MLSFLEKVGNMKFLLNQQLISKGFVLSFFLILNACSAGLSSIDYYILEMPQASIEGTENIKNTQSDQYTESQVKETKMQADINLDGPLISILPVAVPRYLDRPQIVTRNGDVGIFINESSRWGETLPLGIARILSNSLTENLSEIKTCAIPLRMGITSDYTIQVEIINLEGSLDDKVKLKVLWVLQKGEQKLWQSTYEESILAGLTYSSYVQAYASLIDKLGEEMSKVFYNIYEQNNK